MFARNAVVAAFAGVDEADCEQMHLEEALRCRDDLLGHFALRAAATGADGLPCDGIALDAYAHALVPMVQRRRRDAEETGNGELSRRLDAVVDGLVAVDCASCAGVAGAPCGVASHHHIVGNGGRCISEIRSVYDFAVSVGSTLYDDAWAGSSIRPTRRVALEFHTDTIAITGTGGLAGCRAWTDFEESPTRVSVVRLGIDGARYGETERHVLPYLLVHEVVAHAFFDAMSTQPRSQRDPDDFWTEGWMDCVAHQVLLDAIEQAEFGLLRAPPHLLGRTVVIDQCNTAHAARYALVRDRRGAASAPLRVARTRYDGMRRRLRRELGTQAFDPMRTVHLALAIINAQGAADDMVGTFNARSAVFEIAARAAVPFTSAERQIYGSLANFVQHHDADRLKRELA